MYLISLWGRLLCTNSPIITEKPTSDINLVELEFAKMVYWNRFLPFLIFLYLSICSGSASHRFLRSISIKFMVASKAFWSLEKALYTFSIYLYSSRTRPVKELINCFLVGLIGFLTGLGLFETGGAFRDCLRLLVIIGALEGPLVSTLGIFIRCSR